MDAVTQGDEPTTHNTRVGFKRIKVSLAEWQAADLLKQKPNADGRIEFYYYYPVQE